VLTVTTPDGARCERTPGTKAFAVKKSVL
jgi:hypothetical protein